LEPTTALILQRAQRITGLRRDRLPSPRRFDCSQRGRLLRRVLPPPCCHLHCRRHCCYHHCWVASRGRDHQQIILLPVLTASVVLALHTLLRVHTLCTYALLACTGDVPRTSGRPLRVIPSNISVPPYRAVTVSAHLLFFFTRPILASPCSPICPGDKLVPRVGLHSNRLLLPSVYITSLLTSTSIAARPLIVRSNFETCIPSVREEERMR
jgi:hypothetical protein